MFPDPPLNNKSTSISHLIPMLKRLLLHGYFARNSILIIVLLKSIVATSHVLFGYPVQNLVIYERTILTESDWRPNVVQDKEDHETDSNANEEGEVVQTNPADHG